MTYRATRVTIHDGALLSACAALVSKLLPTMSWRHHAIGALQGYVSEGRNPEVRVHIWHPDLVRTDVERDYGRPHDHRFTLRSTVLYGAIGHEELHVTEDAHGDLVEYTVQHARKGPAPLTSTGRRLRARVIGGHISAGQSYEFQPRMYHRSSVLGPAVTLVSKHDQSEDPARVLLPVGCEPSFGVHPFDPEEAKRYVAEAVKWLR